VPDQDWPGENGTLTVVACESLEPVSYLVNGQMLGFDIETLLICAKELDYRLEFEPMEFSDVLSYIQSGKSDLGCGSILITVERWEAMDFATTHENDLVLVTRITEGAGTSSDESGSSWVDGIISSFHKTFVKDNRWTYIVGGLQTTAIITLCSGALGTAIGFMTTLLRRRGMRVANAFVNGFEGLMNRLPIVVVLLVLYYVVFGSTDISGTVVSTIAFTLAFSATAGSIMWNAVQAVDAGQYEASLALGFTKIQSFFGVVLPQAAHQFMLLLSGQFVNLTKQTSVVATSP
jgi:polar amino acid transport system substrate-binding protein